MSLPPKSKPLGNRRATIEQNARAWDRLAREQAALTRPATDEDLHEPLKSVDPLGWLGKSISGKKLLCLAAGGALVGPSCCRRTQAADHGCAGLDG